MRFATDSVVLVAISIFALPGCMPKVASQESIASEVGNCSSAEISQQGELTLFRTKRFNDLSASAFLTVDGGKLEISNHDAEVLRQQILIDGHGYLLASVNKVCTKIEVGDGQIVDRFEGYSSYSTALLSQVEGLRLQFAAKSIDVAKLSTKLYDLYASELTSGEIGAVQLLKTHGMTDDQMRREFEKSIRESLASRQWSEVFATARTQLMSGLFIQHVMGLRLNLPAPKDCNIDYQDNNSPRVRLDQHTRCWSERSDQMGSLVSASHDFRIRAQTTITRTISLKIPSKSKRTFFARDIDYRSLAESSQREIQEFSGSWMGFGAE